MHLSVFPFLLRTWITVFLNLCSSIDRKGKRQRREMHFISIKMLNKLQQVRRLFRLTVDQRSLPPRHASIHSSAIPWLFAIWYSCSLNLTKTSAGSFSASLSVWWRPWAPGSRFWIFLQDSRLLKGTFHGRFSRWSFTAALGTGQEQKLSSQNAWRLRDKNSLYAYLWLHYAPAFKAEIHKRVWRHSNKTKLPESCSFV